MAPRQRCDICDGGKGRRDCPVLEGLICTSCCGSKRGSEIDCPPDCGHFPFGTDSYDLFLKVDEKAIPKMGKYAAQYVNKRRMDEILNHVSYSGERERSLEMVAGVALHYALIYERDGEGKSIADRWEEEGWTSLNNDERVMMRYRKQGFPTVIEIQKITDNKAMQCVDLFDSERRPFTVYDRTMARAMVEYTRLFTWITHYPHFSRPEGGGVEVPDTILEEFLEDVSVSASADSEEPTREGIREYLARNFGSCYGQITAMSREHVRRMFHSMDSHHCTAVYDIAGNRDDIEKILNTKPDFEFDDRDPEPEDPDGTEYYRWLRKGESREIEKSMIAPFRHGDESEGVGSLGTVRVLPEQVVVETFTKQKFEFAKKMIGKYFGDNLVQVNEKIVDVAKQVADMKKDGPDSEPSERPDRRVSSIPPEVEHQVMQQFYREQYAKFLDDRVPMIDGMSPREAAEDPAMRHQLIELMKLHLHNIARMNRDRGMNVDIRWVVEELGLGELL